VSVIVLHYRLTVRIRMVCCMGAGQMSILMVVPNPGNGLEV